MSTIYKVFTRFTKLDRSLDDQVKMAEARTKVANEMPRASKAREANDGN